MGDIIAPILNMRTDTQEVGLSRVTQRISDWPLYEMPLLHQNIKAHDGTENMNWSWEKELKTSGEDKRPGSAKIQSQTSCMILKTTYFCDWCFGIPKNGASTHVSIQGPKITMGGVYLEHTSHSQRADKALKLLTTKAT